MVGTIFSLLSTCVMSFSLCAAEPVLPAFPGAEGFGANTIGGRGGRIIEVTNLNADGPGSFKEAVNASGPRIVVFRVGGTIKGTVTITNPYITIAGQTAPGGGITVRNKPSAGWDGISIKTHDVIIRGIRCRPGPITWKQLGIDAINIGDGSRNIIVDHCSFSWATDEVVHTWYDVKDVTIQWCIISEGLHDSTHEKGPHSKGPIFGDGQAGRISFHHNLMAHNKDRNPMVTAGSGTVDIVNNVMYNYDWGLMVETQEGQYVTPEINAIANYFIAGPNTKSHRWEITTSPRTGGGVQIYLEGNIGPHRISNELPESSLAYAKEYDWDAGEWVYEELTDDSLHPHRSLDKHPSPPITTTSAFEAYDQVLANAGVIAPMRDSVDERIINDVINRTGDIIDDPLEVGGWPELPSGTPPVDSDHDGMPDDWEISHYLNPNDPSDSSGVDIDTRGYTNIEVYINGLFKLSVTESTGNEAQPEQTSSEADCGVKIESAKLSAAGYLIDFRFRVVDAAKAAQIFDRKIMPQMTDQATGAKFTVSSRPKIGQPRIGAIYFILFANPAKYVKSGNKITVEVGDFKVEDIVVN